VLRLKSDFDPRTRYLHIRPEFTQPDGSVILLQDTYGNISEDQRGVLRYLYTKEELLAILQQAGFSFHEYPHPRSRQHFVLIGQKR
jgi:hypothetical protein